MRRGRGARAAAAMKSSIFGLALCASCATTPSTDEPARGAPAPSAASTAEASTSASATESSAPQTAALSIIEGRAAYVRTAGGACERWDLAIAGVVDEDKGTLRHPSEGESDIEVRVRYAQQGNVLTVDEPCLRLGNKDVCLPCHGGPAAVVAYSRKDECEAADKDAAATVAGCSAALDPAYRAWARSVLDGSLRDQVVSRIKKSKRVSLGAGEACTDLTVRKQGKRLMLDPESSPYSYEVTRYRDGTLGIREVAETNPRYHPPPGGEGIGLGCCAGENHRVLEVEGLRVKLLSVPQGTGDYHPRQSALSFGECSMGNAGHVSAPN